VEPTQKTTPVTERCREREAVRTQLWTKLTSVGTFLM
jgi:hypothetical protein